MNLNRRSLLQGLIGSAVASTLPAVPLAPVWGKSFVEKALPKLRQAYMLEFFAYQSVGCSIGSLPNPLPEFK